MHTAGNLCTNFISCKARGYPIKTHDNLSRELGSIAALAGVRVSYEETSILADPNRRQERPGDWRFHNWRDARSECVDLTVVNSLKYLGIGDGGVTAVNRREFEKIAKYRQALEAVGIHFTPFGVTTYGAFGHHAQGMIEQLAVRVARTNDLEVADMMKLIRTRLSIVLQTNIAQSLHAHLGLPDRGFETQVPAVYGRQN
jgi:hypothetical protein